MAALLVMAAGAGTLAAEDRDAGVTHFRGHALAEIAHPAGPDQGLTAMAVEVRLILLQNPLSPVDVAEFGALARGLSKAPPDNRALILDVLTQMLKSARDPQSAKLPAQDRKAALDAALDLAAAGETDSRDAALRYLRATGERAAIGPAIASMQESAPSTRLEAALLLHDHATGPEAAQIRAAITRADPGEDATLHRLFTAILAIGPE